MNRSIAMPAIFSMLTFIGAAAPIAIAQPESAPDPISAPAPDQDPAEFLRHRIESLDAERARLHEALTKLEEGKDWSEVRGDLFRDGRSPGGLDRDDRKSRGDWRSRRGRMDQNFDEEATLESLATVDPEAAERFTTLREENPRVARRLLQSSAPRLHKLEQLRESNPDLYDIEAEQFRIDRQIMHLAWSMHAAVSGNAEADASPLDNVRAELHELVSRQVDLQIEAQKLQLESAKDRIEHLNDKINERIASRDAVIDDRVDRILERAVRSGADRRQRGGDSDRRRERPQRPEQRREQH